MMSYELITKDHEFSLDSAELRPNLARRFGWGMNQLLQIVNLGRDPELLRKEYVSGVFNSLLDNYRKQLEGLEENVGVQKEVVDRIRKGIVRLESEIRGYETTVDSSYRLDMRRLYDGNDSDESNWREFSDADDIGVFKAEMQIDLEKILLANDIEFRDQFKVPKRDYIRAYEQVLPEIEDELARRSLAEVSLEPARERLGILRSEREQHHRRYVDLTLVYQRKRGELELIEINSVSQQNIILAAARAENLSGTAKVIGDIMERMIGEEALARVQIASQAGEHYSQGNGAIIEATAVEVAQLEND